MAAAELPTRPSKGSRRKLDMQWLEKLHLEGYFGPVPDPPAELERGVLEFNRGEYWRSHETLEGIWLGEAYPLRLFYQGLIKTAAGLLHLERHNRRGAAAKLEEAGYNLVPFLPRFMGLDTEGLHGDVMERLTLLRPSENVDWKAIDRLPPVKISH